MWKVLFSPSKSLKIIDPTSVGITIIFIIVYLVEETASPDTLDMDALAEFVNKAALLIEEELGKNYTCYNLINI